MNDFKFEKPNHSQAIVFKEKTSRLIDMDFEFLVGNSCKTIVHVPQTASLRSSCNIDPSSGIGGFVSIESGSWKLPISLVGLADGNIQRFKSDRTVDPTEETDMYMQAREIKACSQICTNTTSTIKERVDYALANNFFSTAFIEQVSNHLPVWIEVTDNIIASTDSIDYSIEGLITKVVSGDVLESSGCVLNETFIYPIDVLGRYVMHRSNSLGNVKILNEEYGSSKTSQACLAIKLNKLGEANTLSMITDSPFTVISAPSPDHVIENLQTSFISVTQNKSELVYADFKLKMKSFGGTFEFKSLFSWNNSAEVCKTDFAFSCKMSACFINYRVQVL